ncbi:MAG: 30S ribosomal protein S20 [Patescibacteria group bacterium]
MSQTKSAEKALRQVKTRTKRNSVVKENIDYLFRQFKKAISDNNKTKAEELAKKLTKAIDKAAKRSIFHKNNAARKKSKMVKKVNTLK